MALSAPETEVVLNVMFCCLIDVVLLVCQVFACYECWYYFLSVFRFATNIDLLETCACYFGIGQNGTSGN